MAPLTHLYRRFLPGYDARSPALCSVHVRAVDGFLRRPVLRAPVRCSRSVRGVLLPCVLGLGSLSLPFPPPPLPACDPTLRPHPSSLCQSGAAQPCRGAERSGAAQRAARRRPDSSAGVRAGGCAVWQDGRAGGRACRALRAPQQLRRTALFSVRAVRSLICLRRCRCCSQCSEMVEKRPCHLNDVSQQAN